MGGESSNTLTRCEGSISKCEERESILQEAGTLQAPIHLAHQGKQCSWSQGKRKLQRDLRVRVGRRISSSKGKESIGQANDWYRLESIFLTEIKTTQDEDLPHFSPSPNKCYKDKQDKYDNNFALKGKSTTASSFNFELECPIAANLQNAMTTVDEEGSEYFYSEGLEEIYFSLD